MKYQLPIKSVIANLQDIVAYIKKYNSNARVILSLVPNVHRRWDRRNDAIQELNEEIVKTFSGLEQTPRGLGIIRENKYFLFL